jgi:hypothetical protein
MAAVKLGLRLLGWIPGRRWHFGKLAAWTRARELPELPGRPSFRSWWRRHGHELKPKPADPATGPAAEGADERPGETP